MTVTKALHNLLIAICLLSPVMLHAEDDFGNTDTAIEEDAVSESRWYQVELMMYRQSVMGNEVIEVWPKDLTLAYPQNWVMLQTPDQYTANTQKKPLVNTPYILLDKKQPAFTQLEKKLQLNRNDILFHATWRQQLKQAKSPSDEINPSILIRGGRRFDNNHELEGSINLRLSRYLHIKTNLWLTRFVPAVAVSESTDTSEVAVDVPAEAWPSLPAYPAESPAPVSDNTLAPLPQYKIEEVILHQQSRRMRSHEVHYIDHPKIGIVVQLIPLDENTMLPIPRKK